MVLMARDYPPAATHGCEILARMNCAFCTDAGRTGEIVFEDGDAWVVVHDDWAVRGHLMIASKQHVENPSGLPPDAWSRFAALWHRVEREVLNLTGCERAIAMKLGIQTPHLHVHLYPVPGTASREDVFAAINGEVRVERDPAFVEALRAALG
jgi:diadenosine tetraphosphate (Ap4A) HIT family hydrolase